MSPPTTLSYMRGEILILPILSSRGCPVSPRATEMTGRRAGSVMVSLSASQTPAVRESQEHRPGQLQPRDTESSPPSHQE